MQIVTSKYQNELERAKRELQVTFGGRSYRICLKGEMPFKIEGLLKRLIKVSKQMKVPLLEARNIYEELKDRFGEKNLRHRSQIEDAVKKIAFEVVAIQEKKKARSEQKSSEIVKVIEVMCQADMKMVAAKHRISGDLFFSEGTFFVFEYWNHIRTSSQAKCVLTHYKVWQRHLLQLIDQFTGFAEDEVAKLVGLGPEEKSLQIGLISEEFYKMFLEKLFDLHVWEFGEIVRNYCFLQLKLTGPSLFKVKLEFLLRDLKLEIEEREGVYQTGGVFDPKEFSVTNFDKAVNQSFRLFDDEGLLEMQLQSNCSYKIAVFEKIGIDDEETAFKDLRVIEKNKAADFALLNIFRLKDDVIERYWNMILSLPHGYSIHQNIFSRWIDFYQRFQSQISFNLVWHNRITEKALVDNVREFENEIFSSFFALIDSEFMSLYHFSSFDEKIGLEYARLQLHTIGKVWMRSHVRSVVEDVISNLEKMPLSSNLDVEEAFEQRDLNVCRLVASLSVETEAERCIESIYGTRLRVLNPWDPSGKGWETVSKFLLQKAEEREFIFKNLS